MTNAPMLSGLLPFLQSAGSRVTLYLLQLFASLHKHIRSSLLFCFLPNGPPGRGGSQVCRAQAFLDLLRLPVVRSCSVCGFCACGHLFDELTLHPSHKEDVASEASYERTCVVPAYFRNAGFMVIFWFGVFFFACLLAIFKTEINTDHLL